MSIRTIKNKVIDKVSDAMSYPARRAAQKSMINSDRAFHSMKNVGTSALKGGVKKAMEGVTPKLRQMEALKRGAVKAITPQISQRDSYARAMNKAQSNGGSNGIGVGK